MLQLRQWLWSDLPCTIKTFIFEKGFLKTVEIINLQMGKSLGTKMRAEIFKKWERKKSKKPVNQKLLEQRELLFKRPTHYAPPRPIGSKRKISVTFKGNVQRDGSANFARPPSSESPVKYESTSLILNCQLGNQFRCAPWVFVQPLAIWKIKKWRRFVNNHCAMANAGKTLCSIYKGAEHSSRLLQVKNDGWR